MPDAFAVSGRCAIFIDAANLWAAQKAKGKLLDYAKLVSVIKEKFQASEARAYYYSAYPENGTRSYSLDGLHKFFTLLEKGLGFIVRKKALKQIQAIDGTRGFEEKGNMDVEMTIDALVAMPDYDIAVLCTGDSDFLALVAYLRNRGKKVYVLSSKNNISHELKTGGDGYEDILNLEADIWGKELRRRKL